MVQQRVFIIPLVYTEELSIQMAVARRELERIRALLEQHSRGLTISELARRLGLNRNTVARYLDVLLLSGQVEMIPVGSAKLFTLAKRIPMIQLFDIVSDGLVVLDRTRRVVQANRVFLRMSGLKEDDVLDRPVDQIAAPGLSEKDVLDRVADALDGNTSLVDMRALVDGTLVDLQVRVAPTILENAQPGVVVVIRDVTEVQRLKSLISDLQDLLRVAMDSVRTPICITDFESGEILFVNSAAASVQQCEVGGVCAQMEQGEAWEDEAKTQPGCRLFADPQQTLNMVDEIVRWTDGRLARLRALPGTPGTRAVDEDCYD